MRTSGILMPVFSLPSKYGIGCFSKEAYQFVDFLKESGQKNWQVLPLGQTSYGDSPYQSFSSFAGNPYFIDLEQLVEQQLLTKAECDSFDFGKNPESIDYAKLYQNRYKILRMACDRFLKQPSDDFFAFCQENDWWLGNYALFMVIKNMHKGASWLQWEEKYKRRDFAALDQVGLGSMMKYSFTVSAVSVFLFNGKNCMRMRHRRAFRLSGTFRFMWLWTAQMPGQNHSCFNLMRS